MVAFTGQWYFHLTAPETSTAENEQHRVQAVALPRACVSRHLASKAGKARGWRKRTWLNVYK